MAKLIKRDASQEGAEPAGTAPGHDPHQTQITQASGNKRGAIIDRSTYEAKSEAVAVRERATSQAEEILQAAREQADTLLAEAKEQAEQMRTQAHAEGLRDGHTEGFSALSEAALRFGARSEESQAELTGQIVTLSMGIAKRILGRELEFHPDAVVEIVKHALSEKARQRREITLRVNPSDVALIRESRPELLEMLSRCKEIAIQEDEEVSAHGVIIETEAGVIDAQLETQLATLERALHDVADR